MTDILLYGPIWQYSAMYFFDQIKEATEDNPEAELNIRINTEGGSPEYGWGIVNKISEMPNARVTVDGMAHSMGLFILAYVNPEKTTVVDTATGVLHRASYGELVESSDWFTDVMRSTLVSINKSLEKAFRARVDVEVLEALPQFKDKNLTLKDIFSLDSREEVLLSASDMKKIGLVKTVQKMIPSLKAEVDLLMGAINQNKSFGAAKMAAQKPEEKSKPEIMTIEDFKSKHPEAYNALVADVKADEQDRVNAWLAFVEVDAKAVTDGIKSGKNLSQTAMADFSVKMFAKNQLAAAAAESTKAIDTTKAPEATPEKTSEEAVLDAEIDKLLNLKKA